MLMLQHILSVAAVAAALAYAAYATLWHKQQDALLVLALLALAMVEGLDSMALAVPESFMFWHKQAMAAEGFMACFFLAYSFVYARGRSLLGVPGKVRALLLAVLLLPLAAALLPEPFFFPSSSLLDGDLPGLTRWTYFYYIAILGCVLLSLVNLEQTMAAATHASRWKIKLVLLGVGTILAGQLIYYSQVFLRGQLDPGLSPVRSLAAVVAVPIIFYSRLRRDEASRIVVSRTVAYNSFVLFAVGLYLIAFGIISAAQKNFQNTGWLPMALALALLTGVGLVAALISETVKRKVKGWIERNFYEDKYDYRKQWMSFTERLAGAMTAEDVAHGVLTAFCETFGLREAALFVVEGGLEPAICPAGCAESGQPARFRYQADVELFQIPRVLRLSPAVLAELNTRGPLQTEDRQFPEDPELTRLREGFHVCLVLPLALRGQLDGLVLLGRPIGGQDHYSTVDFDLMTAMARQGAASIQRMALAQKLSEARDMELLGRVSAFVAHDIKNQVYTLSLMLDNARNFIQDPEFQKDMLDTLGNTVVKMKILISQLRTMPDTPSLKLEPAQLLDVVREALPLVPAGTVNLSGEGARVLVDRDEVRKVALNLILNALEASGGQGPVDILVGRDATPYIRVEDRGCGMEEEFMYNELFKPFRTTKRKGMGIGLFQCKHIVEAHGGRIEVWSVRGQGSVFTVRLPEVGTDATPGGTAPGTESA